MTFGRGRKILLLCFIQNNRHNLRWLPLAERFIVANTMRSNNRLVGLSVTYSRDLDSILAFCLTAWAFYITHEKQFHAAVPDRMRPGRRQNSLSKFGKLTNIRRKESRASVVSEADLASEEFIVRRIRRKFPNHGIIAEESGWQRGDAEYTWVIDPLDGTSNFVAGLPWFGVQMAVARAGVPVLAAMYLPMNDRLYFAQADKGAYRNGRRFRMKTGKELGDVLCAFGMDASDADANNLKKARLLLRVASAVRNIRVTNSLMDFCFTLDGQFGGCINLNTKLWDILPAHLIFQEAGGRLTGLRARKLTYDFSPTAATREYAIIAASNRIHPRIARLTR